MTELFDYLSNRLTNFEQYTIPEINTRQEFIFPLIETFIDRILRQNKSNFMQYIPLFVMAHHTDSIKNDVAKNFTQHLLSGLIRKSLRGQQPKSESLQTAGQLKLSFSNQEHTTERMQAMNYLGSLLSQEIVKIPESTFIKSLNIILSDYQHIKDQVKSSDLSHNSKVFNHCFVQNLALIFASRHDELARFDETKNGLHATICKILFERKRTLELASPFILRDLKDAFENSSDPNSFSR